MILRILLKIEGEGADKDGLDVNLAFINAFDEYNCNTMLHSLYLFGISRFALQLIS